MTRETSEELYVACKLTEAEVLETGTELAERTHQIARLKDELATVKKDYQARIVKAVSEQKTFATMVATGEVHRYIECKIRYETATNMKRWMRVDTGEVARETAIPLDERQHEMPFDEDGQCHE